MAIIVDPDDLNIGTKTDVSDADWGTPTGKNVTITSVGSNLPTIASGEFFVVREHSAANNNGLYIATGSPSSSSLPCTKVSGADPTDEAAEDVDIYGTTGAGSEVSVFIDTDAEDIYLLEQGNLSSDGATLQCVYSFLKIRWKTDAWLPGHRFPLVMNTPEQGEFVEDWNPQDNATHSIRTRKVIRTGGWSEIDADGYLQEQHMGAITLGTMEDEANDKAYYNLGDDPTDTGSTIDFTFAGPVNEAIKTYDYVTPADAVGSGFAITVNKRITRNDGGNWTDDGYRVGGDITIIDAEDSGNDGTWAIETVQDAVDGYIEVVGTPLTNNADDTTMSAAVDNRRAVALYLRIRDGDTYGKSFDKATLSDIGITSVDNKAFRFPLSNAEDQNITATDAQITGGPPWTQIFIRYFSGAYNRDVDSPGTPRNFGIVIDAGTHSGIDGVTAGGSALTTAEGGIPATTYDGGTLRVHEGTDKGDWTITTATGTTVNISGSFAGSESNLSFTLIRSTPLAPDKYEIFEKVQYLLRQASDIDSTGDVVNGKTADELMEFSGSDVKVGNGIPANPNGGGTGVIIEGFDPNNTNDLSFWDNTGTERSYPFVSAGTISWNEYLENDVNGFYWMYFTYTERFTNTGFGTSASSGDTCTLDSSVTNLVSELADGDYITLSGFTDPDVGGIYVLTGAPAGAGPWTAPLRRVNGEDCVDESAGASVSLDKNPIDTPDAILVKDNSDTDIKGSTYGASSDTFDFDYDNNVQGGRTAGTDAAITVRALGYDTAQWVETTGTITQSTGIPLSLVAALERNYSNP